eukprot:jgi/Picsp_1/3146/NSC_05986-R1_ycf21 gene product
MVNFLSGNRPLCATTIKAHSLNGSKRGAFCAELIGWTRLHASRNENGYFQLEEVLWRGKEEDALEPDSLPRQLTAPWKSIGVVDALEFPCKLGNIIGDTSLVRRQVFLRFPDRLPSSYVYATSWWQEDVVNMYLRDKEKPIWVSLSSERTELYREILEVAYGHCPILERHFGCAGPFWARTYVFWHNKKPLTVIYEIFSPKLSEFLGPSQPTSML